MFRKISFAWLVIVLFLIPMKIAGAQTSRPVVVTLRFENALNPVWQEHLKRATQVADQRGASVIILELDTPGGSIDLMNKLVSQIRESKVPVVVYVTPRGAMAASAGTLLTLAGHASAMAPETTIGAASPVGSQGEDIGETMESKVKEMLRASVRSLAAERGPKAVELAQEMIQEARAVSVDEALEVGLVDFKASSLGDLLTQLDGFEVKVQDQTVILNTAEATIIDVPQTFMEEALSVLANANLVFLLLAIGVQAVLIELSSPGGWVAGFIGAVCLLLAAYGLGVLPVNWFGILFMIMAFVLFVLEIKTPTMGALTIAGAVSFIVGALVLFNSPTVPTFQRVSVPLVVGTGVFLGILFFILVAFGLRAQRSPQRMGNQALIGKIGVVSTPLNPSGTVQIDSELWSALIDEDGPVVPRGSHVQVVSYENLQVRVKRVNKGKTGGNIG